VDLKCVLELVCIADTYELVFWISGHLSGNVFSGIHICVCVCVCLYLWENGRIGKHVFGLSMLLIGKCGWVISCEFSYSCVGTQNDHFLKWFLVCSKSDLFMTTCWSNLFYSEGWI